MASKFDVFVKSRDFIENVIPAKQTVSHYVILAKPRVAGREPGSRKFWIYSVLLDSGSRDTLHRSSGMTAFFITTQSGKPESREFNSFWMPVEDLVFIGD